MRSHPAFDLFEEVCVELRDQDETVLTDVEFADATVDRLKRAFQETTNQAAINKAILYLRGHFEARGSALPFDYDLATGRVTATSRDYINFVCDSQEQRSKPKVSRDFECATSNHLATKLTGLVRRVGSPRRKHKTRKRFAAYLIKEFKFRKGVLKGQDKDGGLDILWFPPLGAFPFRAIVSIQCKNSPYDRDDGFQSVGRAKQMLSRHPYAGETHLHCVLYNDYIDDKLMDHARTAEFVPLGLSDLAPLIVSVTVDRL